MIPCKESSLLAWGLHLLRKQKKKKKKPLSKGTTT